MLLALTVREWKNIRVINDGCYFPFLNGLIFNVAVSECWRVCKVAYCTKERRFLLQSTLETIIFIIGFP